MPDESSAARRQVTVGRLRVSRRLLVSETAVVVGLALGLSALRSILHFLGAAMTPGRLSSRAVTLNGSLAPGQPWIDLGLQMVFVASLLLPVALVVVLAGRGGEPLANFGLRFDRWGRDVTLGLATASAVGGVGLAGYLLAHAAGSSLTVVATDLPAVWWRVPVLVLSAVGNAALEEVVMVGYLVRRMRQLGRPAGHAIAVSGGIRAAYHVYQGLAGCLGNAAMGVLFAAYFSRSGRILPQIVAHAVIDIVAFVGFLTLAGHVSWLPR